MKAEKFKVGDKVLCVELGNKTEGAHYSREDGHELGKEYTVTMVGDNGLQGEDGKWIEISDGIFWHHVDSFEHKPDALTIVLRRPVDRTSIEKFLDKSGYKQRGDQSDVRKTASRIINVHFRGKCVGQRTYNGNVTYVAGTKQAIVKNNKLMKDEYFDHKNIKVIRSKPSVKQAINQIKKYI